MAREAEMIETYVRGKEAIRQVDITFSFLLLISSKSYRSPLFFLLTDLSVWLLIISFLRLHRSKSVAPAAEEDLKGQEHLPGLTQRVLRYSTLNLENKVCFSRNGGGSGYGTSECYRCNKCCYRE